VLRTKTMLKIKKRICFSKKRKYSRFMLCVSALANLSTPLYRRGAFLCRWYICVLCILTAWFKAIFYLWFDAMYLFMNSLTVAMIASWQTSWQSVAVSGRFSERPKLLFTVILHGPVLRNAVLTSHSS